MQVGTRRKSSVTSTISADAAAISVPWAPSAMPTAPALSASESLMPSPTTKRTITRAHLGENALELVVGKRLRLQIPDPDERGDAMRHRPGSPVSSSWRVTPSVRNSAKAEAASGRGSSASRIQPRKPLPSATPTTGPS